ncbi:MULTISPECIES: hypothetical protein [Legionella]|uniref:Uncharacterized protein n=1 Tax=Legionella drozanskii LLAP-1 TaxID=1212489 RepID=A0A0W0TBG1_9GAMM|nr:MULTISPECIES: hypothetical protein [Legionella]KTC92864.1 hypothetical protein Ldro_0235 [Legionella drozanskii LLAP-1]PJE12965.1 MAG: hypothetical protein CK430_07020 [Legionella sp.]
MKRKRETEKSNYYSSTWNLPRKRKNEESEVIKLSGEEKASDLSGDNGVLPAQVQGYTTTSADSSIPPVNVFSWPQPTLPTDSQSNGIMVYPQNLYYPSYYQALGMYYANRLALIELEIKRIENEIREEAEIDQMAIELRKEVEIDSMAAELRKEIETEVTSPSETNETSREEGKNQQTNQIGVEIADRTIYNFFQPQTELGSSSHSSALTSTDNFYNF